jgi:hypothetical protein
MTLRLLMKFAVAAVMLLLLLLFSSTEGVDFVYTGF